MGRKRRAPEHAGDDLALPRPPGALQRWLARHPRGVDWTIAIACELPLLALGIVMPATDTGTWGQLVAIVLSAAIGFVALLYRRRFPLAGTLVLAGVAFIGTLAPSDFTVGGWVDSWVLLFSLGIYSTTRRLWLGYAAMSGASVIGGVVAGLLIPSSAAANPLLPTIGTPMLIVYLVPTLIGLSVGGRRRYIAAIIARAEDLARERDQRARLAVTEERARVAREMHDIVSHGLTVMITLSEGAAAQADAGASGAPDAMRRVASAGRDALGDMRRLLGLLRDPDAPAELAPQPTGADLAQLIDGFREAGLPVRLTQTGPAIGSSAGPDDAGGGTVRSDMPLAAYRIVQEGLTNVLRHAPGAARVDAAIENGADALTITIENSRDPGAADARAAGGVGSGDGSARPGSSDASAQGGPVPRDRSIPGRATTRGAGRGLIGARERAALHDGTLDAGPTPSGGWLLRAVLRTDRADAAADASAPHQPAPHESTVREATPYESSVHESTPHESTVHESMSRESAPHEPTPHRPSPPGSAA